VPTPDDFLVVAAGGRAGAFSAYVPGWGEKRTSQSVTREIRRKHEGTADLRPHV
jgi:hypothetical protein